MNTHGNARGRKTREALQAALISLLADKKMLSEISVRELCQLSGVHKSTFYAHYESVTSFAEKVLSECFGNVNEPISRAIKFAPNSAFEQQLSARIMGILKIVRENRLLCLAYLADPVSRARYEAQLERVDNHLIENKKYDTELFSESEIRYEFISRHASFYAIVEAWLKRDCAESEEMIAWIIVRKLSA